MKESDEIVILKKRIKQLETMLGKTAFDETKVLTPFTDKETMNKFVGWKGYFSCGRDSMENKFFFGGKIEKLSLARYGRSLPFVYETEYGYLREFQFFYPISKED